MKGGSGRREGELGSMMPACAPARPRSPLPVLLFARGRPAQGKLKEGWRDTDGTDLTELTWRVSQKISPSLTPQLLGAAY